MIVRRKRTRRPGVVAVTGAATGLGAELLARLAARTDLRGVVAVDAAVPEPVSGGAPQPAVPWRTADVRAPLDPVCFAGVDVVVHLATSYDAGEEAAARRALNVGGTASVLEAARLAGVRRVVLATSVDVYGARVDNAVPLPEDAPLRGEPDDVTLAGDHVEVERLAGHALRTGLDVTVLRPATLVGGALGPAYDGQQLRRLSGALLLATRGHEPLWQLCHTDDLVTALELAAVGAVGGGVAVACASALEQARVEALTGQRRLELPPAVALSTAERLHRYGVTSSSRRELEHVLAPLVLQPAALVAAGWEPRWTNEAALVAHLASRGPDGRGGAVGAAAGATVAIVGTAALVRAARRKRRRR